MKTGKNKISAKNLDKKIDDGKDDVLQYFDLSNTTRRILVDFPEWMIKAIDVEAKHLGISRQAIIKFWIDEKIRERAPKLRAVG